MCRARRQLPREDQNCQTRQTAARCLHGRGGEPGPWRKNTQCFGKAARAQGSPFKANLNMLSWGAASQSGFLELHEKYMSFAGKLEKRFLEQPILPTTA